MLFNCHILLVIIPLILSTFNKKEAVIAEATEKVSGLLNFFEKNKNAKRKSKNLQYI